MPGERRSLWDTLRQGAKSEEEMALNFLFPAKNKFEMLQMLTETQPRAVIPFAVLDVFRQKYHSKVLTSFTGSHNTIKVGQERKGRLEGSEVVVGIRKALSTKDED
ncbi:hypothetical protein LCGC14_1838230 [marine sediment metagenome]|uniref:Uncharacterized protein n=1 Tax=marine sediment metagenome TaxID=412755 RepID=A0A0F9H262_9ZZZZ